MSHDEHAAECRECDGTGAFMRGAVERECHYCDGTGEREVREWLPRDRAREVRL
jgi:DnaJ-class molecular chaperone